MKTFKILFISLFVLLTSNTAKAQCTYKNTAFKSGESRLRLTLFKALTTSDLPIREASSHAAVRRPISILFCAIHCFVTTVLIWHRFIIAKERTRENAILSTRFFTHTLTESAMCANTDVITMAPIRGHSIAILIVFTT